MKSLLCCLILLAVVGCASTAPTKEEARQQPTFPEAQPPPVRQEPSGRTTPLASLPTITLTIKDKKVRLWVANKEDTQREGLMFVTRDEMAEDQGMIFVFPDLDYRGFWMKNTLIPLDIAFLRSDGTIINILTMSPLDESTYRSEAPAQYAIEMHAGWFERNGIRAGDRVHLAPLARLNQE
jgi:uncharacterized membrane protein (UPF0127 family)